MRSLQPEGLCFGATIHLEDPHVPYFHMYSKGAHFVTGRVNARAAMPEVLDLVQAGRIDPRAVTEEVFSWKDAPEVVRGDSAKPVFVR